MLLTLPETNSLKQIHYTARCKNPETRVTRTAKTGPFKELQDILISYSVSQ